MNDEQTLLYKMMLIREFENVLGEEKLKRNIYGMVHCCNGQEAVAVGVCSALNESDYIVSNHRPHGHAIAKGVDIHPIMAELFGKSTGTNSGVGGSMHITDESVGFITATGIVGSGIPVACGAAFSSKYKQDGKVTCVFMGDGSANEGVFFESLNLAAKWELPVIFVLEDNGLAVTTHTDDTSACREYSKLAETFGIESICIDGQNVQEVYSQSKRIVDLVRRQSIPFFIHAKTIRFREHAEGEYYLNMKGTCYRDFDKLNKEMEERCPIASYRKQLIESGALTEDIYTDLCEHVKREVADALDYAINSPDPMTETARKNLFWEGTK